MEKLAICPSCGGRLAHQEGCISCPNCGWSECDDFRKEVPNFDTCKFIIPISYYPKLQRDM